MVKKKTSSLGHGLLLDVQHRTRLSGCTPQVCSCRSWTLRPQRTHTNLSVEKRAAQLLGGEDVCNTIFESLLLSGSGTGPRARKMLLNKATDLVIVSHWTPMDGCLEKALLAKSVAGGLCSFAVCSCGVNTEHAMMAMKRIKTDLMEDWMTGTYRLMPRPQFAYDPTLPAAEASKYEPTPAPENLVMISLQTVDGQVRPTLADEVRARWQGDAVHGPEWVNQISQFDQTLATHNLAAAGQATRPSCSDAIDSADVPSFDGPWLVKDREEALGHGAVATEMSTSITHLLLITLLITDEAEPGALRSNRS